MPLEEFRLLFDRYKDALVASSHRTTEYALGPRSCADRIVFFNCTELARPERRAVETVFDWNAYAPGGLEIHSVPGNHYSMLFEPAVGALAVAIQRCLDDVEGRLDAEPPTSEPVRT
jgi:thioesterase domain-containing protein